jgi:hypothetical protein
LLPKISRSDEDRPVRFRIASQFRREADIFEPALIEEFRGAIRSSRPYQPRNGVNHEANVFRLSRVCGTMPRRCHPRIIVFLLDSRRW